ncbi:MAG TPA: GNAT family N-acetyltransferase [Anaerolineales bacterium]|nr:GNAT family N-acetyltransferase [Anaerolineales bacterium]
MIEVRRVENASQKRQFLTFPWKLYRNDPLWVPPLYDERKQLTDPARSHFFQGGYADFYLAYKNGKLAGTICCSHEDGGDPQECSLGFFETENDYEIAAALFQQAECWARDHGLSMLCGTYNLDREDRRGILVDGYDRPAALLCGHNPPYYHEFFEAYGFGKRHDDGLAYACPIDERSAPIRRLYRLADQVRARKSFIIRHANMQDFDNEIERITTLQNQAMAHLPGFVLYTHAAVEGMILPLKDLADPELILFAEADGQVVGWFPAIPDFNEILIHLNGLRHPWNYINALRYKNLQPKCLTVKSVAVPPEYWDTGVAVLLFAEMAQRANRKGYEWLDLSLTGDENPDTWDLAHHMGAKIYKRYRFYRKDL